MAELPEGHGERLPKTEQRQFTWRFGLRLFGLTCVLISMLVGYVGLKHQSDRKTLITNELLTPGYGEREVEDAVSQIEIGTSTRKDVNTLLGPYVVSRGLFRIKETGGDRNYFFLVGDRQIWMEFSTGPEGVAMVSDLGKLDPKAKFIKRWEGGYLTFSPDEYPWE